MSGTTTRPSANPILDMMRDEMGVGDWATVMGYWFAVAETSYRLGLDIPAEWEFRPSPALQAEEPVETLEEWPDSQVWEMARDGEVSPVELIRAGNALSRYAGWLKADGQAY